jgi:hypothetical protein
MFDLISDSHSFSSKSNFLRFRKCLVLLLTIVNSMSERQKRKRGKVYAGDIATCAIV